MKAEEFQYYWSTRDKALFWRRTRMLLIAGVILSIITPYESSNIPFVAGQFIYWMGLLAFAAIAVGPIARKLFPVLAARKISAVPVYFIYTATLSVPVFIIVVAGDLLVRRLYIQPDGPLGAYTSDFLLSVEYGVFGYLYWFGQVWIINLLIIGPISLGLDKLQKPDTVKLIARAGQRFLNRLPRALGKDLICLSMEDHYIRACTKKGDTLILMRMADAVAELEGYPGLQVHRSWWVAADAIEKVCKDQRKHTVHLQNDIQAPVSQRYVEKLKEAGLI